METSRRSNWKIAYTGYRGKEKGRSGNEAILYPKEDEKMEGWTLKRDEQFQNLFGRQSEKNVDKYYQQNEEWLKPDLEMEYSENRSVKARI